MDVIEIDDLDDEGRGIGSLASLQVHVAGALPGERVEVQLEHRSPHRPEAWANLHRIERACAERIAPVCPSTGRCGGCPLGTLAYPAQLAWKEARLASIVPHQTKPIVPSPKPIAYRNHAKLVYGAGVLGAYAPRSHAIVDLAGCRVVEPILDEVRAALLRSLDAQPFDERTGRGVLAYVALRSDHAGRVLATLVGPDLDALERVAPTLDAHPALVGIALNRRPRGNAIFGRETRVLHGASGLVVELGPIAVHASPTAFVQVNRDVAARIYADVADFIAPRARTAADLYCGVGGIALTLAARGVEVLGVESNAEAVRDAERVESTARFIVADATRIELGAPDAIVVNPPRRGLEPSLLEAIARAHPAHLAYVSCNPTTLARDLAVLERDGLTVERIGAYDMHPQTPHIETLALLSRR